MYPRVTAVVGMVGYHFLWMDAHHIKQTIFTTADDDYRPVMMKMKTPDGKEVATQVLVDNMVMRILDGGY